MTVARWLSTDSSSGDAIVPHSLRHSQQRVRLSVSTRFCRIECISYRRVAAECTVLHCTVARRMIVRFDSAERWPLMHSLTAYAFTDVDAWCVRNRHIRVLDQRTRRDEVHQLTCRYMLSCYSSHSTPHMRFDTLHYTADYTTVTRTRS